ncbi:hypothetical protein LP417_31950 [Polaromonas sp. P1-6]|nr:hypothetical protein LP417_31950 [Polaromonas sp. P1-6]
MPVESVTDLKTCSTEIIEAIKEPGEVEDASLTTETAGSNMSALSENLKSMTPDFNKLANWATNRG